MSLDGMFIATIQANKVAPVPRIPRAPIHQESAMNATTLPAAGTYAPATATITEIAALVARLSLGVMFLAHGLMKFLTFTRPGRQSPSSSTIGQRPTGTRSPLRWKSAKGTSRGSSRLEP